MSELENLLYEIEKLRENLNKLIEKKQQNFQDPEIIAASKTLNTAISKYNELVFKKL